MHSGSPDALFAAISQSSNEVTQGWMRVLANAPAAAAALPWGDASLQRSYYDKQARLWSALASGRRETLAEPAPGARDQEVPVGKVVFHRRIHTIDWM